QEDVGRAEAAANGLLEPLSRLLLAPLDRRTHRELTDEAAPPANSRRPRRDEGLYVIAHVDIGGPARAQDEAAPQRSAAHARRSEGNRSFEVWQQLDRTNHFNLVSFWSDRSHFQSFAASDGAREFRKLVGPLIGSPYDERFYRLSGR